MRTRIALILFLPMLWSCATKETRPAVDASLYLFDLEVDVAPELSGFDPDVAKGGGSGMLRGAGMGLGGCIMFGLEADATSGGSTFMLGTVIGVIISPACALVGGVAGGSIAETAEDVAARVEILNTAASDLGYPSSLAALVSSNLEASPVYQIHQSSDNPPNSEIEEAIHDAPASLEPVNVLVPVGKPETSPASEPLHEGPLTETLPVRSPPDTVNGIIRIHIEGYALTGGGVDPKMPLTLRAKVCVSDNETGSALISTYINLQSKARKLEDWAELGKEGLENETLALVDQLDARLHMVMGQQVRLDFKTSCEKSSMKKFFLGQG